MAFIPQIVCSAVGEAVRFLREVFDLLSENDVLVKGGPVADLPAVFSAPPVPSPMLLPTAGSPEVACAQNCTGIGVRTKENGQIGK